MSRKRLSLFFILGWSFLTVVWLSQSLNASLRIYPYLWGISLAEKERILEGDLYAAAKVCERKMPAAEPLFFYNISKQPRKTYTGHSADFTRGHDRQKISYLLYPKRVYWDMEEVKEPIRYVLVYHAKVELEGFEHLVDLAEDIYLLKMKETQ